MLAALAGICTYLVVRGADRAPIAVWVALLSVAVILVSRWTAPAFLSPVVIVSVGLIAATVAGDSFYSSVADAPEGGGIYLNPNGVLMHRTAVLLLLAATSFLLSAGLVAAISRPRLLKPRQARLPTGRARTGLLVLATLPLPITVWLSDPAGLLDRPYYLATNFGGGLAGSTSSLATIAVAILGYLIRVDRGRRQLLASLAVVGYVLLFFALGTRQLALVPILLAVGFGSHAPDRRTLALLGGATVLSLYLIPLPLYLRGLSAHGLLNYLPALSGYHFGSAGLSSVLRNVLIGYPIVGVSAYASGVFPHQYFWVSVNPLPGSMAGWYPIAPTLRLNVFTPTGAVGELGNYGTKFVVGYFAVAGLVCGWLDLEVRRLLEAGRQLIALAVVGLIALFVLFSTQYNLRADTRFLYYSVVVVLAARFFPRSRAPRPVPGASDLSMADLGVSTLGAADLGEG